MIKNIGTDIIEIARMAAAYERHGKRMAERVLAPQERQNFNASKDPVRFLAKRWAAKEALAKALGTGIRGPVSFLAMEVTHDEAGQPGFHFDNEMQALLIQKRIGRVHLSITDERHYALAFVVAEMIDFSR